MDEFNSRETRTLNQIFGILLQDPSRLELVREHINQSNRPRPPSPPRRSIQMSPLLTPDASKPRNQLRDEAKDELARLAKDRTWGPYPITVDPSMVAEENVKKRWREQGIWNDKWATLDRDRWLWKHEELFISEHYRATDEQRRERDASRPFHRFVYQLNQERDRIQDEYLGSLEPWLREIRVRDTHVPEAWVSRSVNARAYQRVKDAWVERGIWYDRWGVMPGMTWKHEHAPDLRILFGKPSPSVDDDDDSGDSDSDSDKDTSEHRFPSEHVTAAPVALPPSGNDAHKRDGGERGADEQSGFVRGLGCSSPPQPPDLGPSFLSPPQPQLHFQSLQFSAPKSRLFPPARRSGRLQGKRKQGADASDEPCGSDAAEAEAGGDGRTKKRR